jgi:sugar phosphate isomerase/epimerase
VPPTTFTPVGAGAVDFPAVLKAAAAAGVEHYFVEQDHAQGDPIAALKQSYQYLRTI